MAATLTLDEVQAAVDQAQQELEVAGLAPTPTPAPEPEKDPWAPEGRDIRVGDPVPDKLIPDYTQTRCGVREAGVPAHGYVNCMRPEGHPPHHAHVYVYNNSAAWVWGREDPPLAETPEVLKDPEDAAVTDWKVGMRVSYRNKRDVLVVLSRPKLRHKEVEVLDLGHKRFRKIKKELVVPARPDDPQVTQEQMRWVGEFIAKRKGSALEIAQRELEKRSWTRGQMNESLAKIDIAKQPSQYGTTIEVNFDIKLPTGAARMSATAVRQMVNEAVTEMVNEKFIVDRVNHTYGGELRER